MIDEVTRSDSAADRASEAEQVFDADWNLNLVDEDTLDWLQYKLDREEGPYTPV